MEQSIMIAGSVEAVFALRAALHLRQEWQAEVLTTDLFTDTPIAVGTQGTERRRDSKDSLLDWDIEVTEFERDRVLCLTSRCGGVRICERDMFTSDGENTKFTTHIEVTGSPLPAAAFHRRTVDTLLRFKWWIEGRRDARADPSS
jgi:hypothetical protein